MNPVLRRNIFFFVLLPGLLALSGCSWFGGGKDEREKTRELAEQELYERAQELLDSGIYDLAIENLQLLESRFPFGRYATQAQLEIIYAYYQGAEEGAAVAAAERFLRLHPSHPHVDYAWYMKALANYSLKPGVLSRFVATDFSARDIDPARQSFFDFQQFLQRYPNSIYAADARVRMIHTKHALARHEMHVANYYISRRAFQAAINRAQNVLREYQGADSTADALAISVYSYQQIGETELAEQQLAILQKNFPEHETLNADGSFVYTGYDQNRRSFLNRLTLGFVDAPKAPNFDSRS